MSIGSPYAVYPGGFEWSRTSCRAARLPVLGAHARPSIAAAILGLVLSFTAWLMVSRWEDRQAELAFNAVAENRFLVLQNGLNAYLHKVVALRALFEASQHVTRAEFEGFSHSLLQSSSGIQTLSWIPRVSRSERAAYELAAASDVASGYHIKTVNIDRSLTVSGDRDEYFPIYYSTVPRTSPLYGLNLGSTPATLAELEYARDGDKFGFSEIPALKSADGNQHGFIFSLPVFRGRLPNGNVQSRRQDLAGFVHGSLITANMIETIIAATTIPQGVDLYFFRNTSGPDEPALYTHGSRLRSMSLEPQSTAAVETRPHWSRELTIGNDRWMTLAAVPMPGGPLTPSHERAWIVLVCGMIVTGLAVAYLCALGRYAFRLVRANKRVSELAQTDTLTGLANRRAFVDRLTVAFAQMGRGANPFGVLYFDLDHFKDVNDTLGHPAGDELLRQVTERVTKLVRETDLVARLGGDEFAVLQSHVPDHAAVSKLAAKIMKAIAKPYTLSGNEVRVTASIGISFYSPDVAGPEAMMIQADLALYRAKEDGRNCFRFHSQGLDDQVRQRVTIADDLRVAIERDELELHYQPQVELTTGRLVGLEALLRWNHPKQGLISPATFIPIAERTGAIIPLGEWVLEKACQQLKSWQDQGLAPEVLAVNFSAVQFKGPSKLERSIAENLKRWEIAPHNFEVELTESVLMEVSDQHSETLQRLRQLGVKIAIDDFGTGYSSLTYLTTYPVSRLKIAQQLVFGVTSDLRNATVVRAAIRLAHELGIEVIAEGVENEDQANFLIGAGCAHAQGYYFSRPVTAENATELLRHERRAELRTVLEAKAA